MPLKQWRVKHRHTFKDTMPGREDPMTQNEENTSEVEGEEERNVGTRRIGCRGVFLTEKSTMIPMEYPQNSEVEQNIGTQTIGRLGVLCYPSLSGFLSFATMGGGCIGTIVG